jgi:hypothetical protein
LKSLGVVAFCLSSVVIVLWRRALRGRVVDQDGKVSEPPVLLNDLDVNLCRKIGNKFAITTRQVSKRAIMETLHQMKPRADGLAGDSGDEFIMAASIGRKDIIVNRFIHLVFSACSS